MTWQTMESADRETYQLLAYGHPIEPISGLLNNMTHAFIEWSDHRECWVTSEGDRFHPLGWIDIPDYQLTSPIQPVPEGRPKYAVGDMTTYETCYDGPQQVTITSVHIWPNGFYYGLDTMWHTGHGNADVGADEIKYFHDGGLCRRPISEWELDYRSDVR